MVAKNGGRKGPPSRGEFSGVQLEVRGLGVKMDVLTERVDVLTDRVDGLNDRVDVLTERVDVLTGHVVVLGDRMNENTGVLRQILRAVEAGNERRDTRVDAIDARVRRLEARSGPPPRRKS